MRQTLLIIFIISILNNIYFTCGKRIPRMVEGNNVTIEDFPYLVKIYEGRKYSCGGAIIDPSWILTAAHCLVDVTRQLRVVAGNSYSNPVDGEEDIQIRKVSKIIPHEKYNDDTSFNDIGLIKLDQELNFTSTVQPIQLTNEPDVPKNTIVTLAAWGSSKRNGPLSYVLKKSEWKVMNQKKCKKIMWRRGDTVTHKQFCTFNPDNKGTCSGDSGSPLIDQNKKLIGVVSYGPEVCGTGYPDVYTKVYSYLPWVKKVIDNQ